MSDERLCDTCTYRNNPDECPGGITENENGESCSGFTTENCPRCYSTPCICYEQFDEEDLKA